jgi:hydrogenase maturation protease
MRKKDNRILVLGYGNPSRSDDDLGPAFARAVERMKIEGLTVETNYQLTVEDAKSIACHDVVIFVDATVGGPEPFGFGGIRPDFTLNFHSHRIEPAALLAMAYGIFGAQTEGYVLGIRGYDFPRFGESLSPGARDNLEAALEFLLPVLKKGLLRKEAVRLRGRTRNAAMRLSHV